jgi:hypothetical protein
MNDSEKNISTGRRSKILTKKRGRPSRNGVKEPWQFKRALMVIYRYTKAREQGAKHAAAVQEAVDFVRQLDPQLSVSQTEARRILAEFLPQGSQVALTVEYSILEGEEAARRRFYAQTPEFTGTKSAADLSDQNLRKPLRCFKFGVGKRPNYHRHNAKILNP